MNARTSSLVTKVDTLSTFRDALKAIERKFLPSGRMDPSQQRNTLISQLETYRNSRYHLGRALRGYKQIFKAERAWMAVVEVIANAIGRDERTVMRIVDDYERANQLPPIVLEAMLEQNIDPPQKRNSALVENLLQMPTPETSGDARAAVGAAVRAEKAAKKVRRQPSSKEDAEAFARRIAKAFELRYRKMPGEERDAELRFVFEYVVSTLQAKMPELRQFGPTVLVPKLAGHGAA